MFVLRTPEGQLLRFNYGGSGMGWTFPFPKMLRLPQLTLPKIMLSGHEFGAIGSTADFPSNGVVYVTEACHGPDLSAQQIEGGTIYFDGGLGYLRGYGVSVFLAGLNEELMEAGILIPRAMELAIASAPAVIFIKGQNEGLQESVGGGILFGQIAEKGQYDDQ